MYIDVLYVLLCMHVLYLLFRRFVKESVVRHESLIVQ